MSEILSSLHADFKERLASPVYGVFIITWSIVNWEFVYTALFVSEEKIWEATEGVLKNTYLKESFFNYVSFEFYLRLLVPAFLTWLIIWHLPKYITLPAFKQSEINRNEKFKILNQIKLESSKLELKQVTLEGEKIEKEEEVGRLKNQRAVDEYNKLKVNPLFTQFSKVVDIIYSSGGKTGEWENGYYMKKINPNLLALLDTKGLIKISEIDREETIEFTSLGRDVFALYLDEFPK